MRTFYKYKDVCLCHSFPTELCLKEPLIDLKEDLSEDDIEKMISHINEINNIRYKVHLPDTVWSRKVSKAGRGWPTPVTCSSLLHRLLPHSELLLTLYK